MPSDNHLTQEFGRVYDSTGRQETQYGLLTDGTNFWVSRDSLSDETPATFPLPADVAPVASQISDGNNQMEEVVFVDSPLPAFHQDSSSDDEPMKDTHLTSAWDVHDRDRSGNVSTVSRDSPFPPGNHNSNNNVPHSAMPIWRPTSIPPAAGQSNEHNVSLSGNTEVQVGLALSPMPEFGDRFVSPVAGHESGKLVFIDPMPAFEAPTNPAGERMAGPRSTLRTFEDRFGLPEAGAEGGKLFLLDPLPEFQPAINTSEEEIDGPHSPVHMFGDRFASPAAGDMNGEFFVIESEAQSEPAVNYAEEAMVRESSLLPMFGDRFVSPAAENEDGRLFVTESIPEFDAVVSTRADDENMALPFSSPMPEFESGLDDTEQEIGSTTSHSPMSGERPFPAAAFNSNDERDSGFVHTPADPRSAANEGEEGIGNEQSPLGMFGERSESPNMRSRDRYAHLFFVNPLPEFGTDPDPHGITMSPFQGAVSHNHLLNIAEYVGAGQSPLVMVDLLYPSPPTGEHEEEDWFYSYPVLPINETADESSLYGEGEQNNLNDNPLPAIDMWTADEQPIKAEQQWDVGDLAPPVFDDRFDSSNLPERQVEEPSGWMGQDPMPAFGEDDAASRQLEGSQEVLDDNITFLQEPLPEFGESNKTWPVTEPAHPPDTDHNIEQVGRREAIQQTVGSQSPTVRFLSTFLPAFGEENASYDDQHADNHMQTDLDAGRPSADTTDEQPDRRTYLRAKARTGRVVSFAGIESAGSETDSEGSK
ncbi:hypothetical protein BDW22DRAFT_1425607 [Trametopsis cervina]|nr:hypothetical protein BDW22DRAFT_1425607 [Trametopsis cervina]